jgi:hypothetical protein
MDLLTLDGNVFLKHLLVPLERETKDVFSVIECSFAHLPAVCKWMYIFFINFLHL